MTLITVGWCLQAQAQPTDFSLPPLPDMGINNPNGSTGTAPPIPSTPIAPNAGAQKNTVAVSEASDAPMAIPELAGLPIPAAPSPVGATATAPGTTAATTDSASTPPSSTTATPATADTAAAPPSLPGAPSLPGIAEQTDSVMGEGEGPQVPAPTNSLAVAAPPTTLPGFDLPLPPSSVASTPAPTSTPATVATATSLPEIDVEGPPKSKMGGRTWTTKLAPVAQASTRGFNYRRQVLPDAIYRKTYDYENQHLPIQVTRNDYSRLLVERVAANDINGTRALLNEGISVNTVDGYGQSLLAVARRAGARDTERLLIARGAS